VTDVVLRELDDELRAALRDPSRGSVRLAAGFPRAEDTDAVDAAELGALGFAILADDVVVGTCGTHGPAAHDGTIELGWGLVEGARGRGVGSAAVTQLLEAVTARLGAVGLVAHTQWRLDDGVLGADSPASEAILVANGFASPGVPEVPGRRAWRRDPGAARAAC
jgi:GNAT superfamily N-acetyltransferase